MVHECPDILLHKIPCKQGAVRAVRFNVDGTYCATAGGDRTIKLWNPHKALLLKAYTGHSNEPLDVRCTPDSSQIISAGLEKTLFIWDVSSGNIIRKIRAHESQVNCLAVGPEGGTYITGSLDGTAKIWDGKSRNWTPIQVLGECKDSVTSIGVSENEIVLTSLDGKCRKYDVRRGNLQVDDLSSPLGSGWLTKDGKCMLVGCLSSQLYLLDSDSGEVLQRFAGHENTKYKIDCALTCSDSVVACGSENGYIYLWDIFKGTLVTKLNHSNGRTVHSMDAHPLLPELISASESNIYLWTSDLEVKDD